MGRRVRIRRGVDPEAEILRVKTEIEAVKKMGSKTASALINSVEDFDLLADEHMRLRILFALHLRMGLRYPDSSPTVRARKVEEEALSFGMNKHYVQHAIEGCWNILSAQKLHG